MDGVIDASVKAVFALITFGGKVSLLLQKEAVNAIDNFLCHPWHNFHSFITNHLRPLWE
jgi:hypothetical protein